MRSYLKKSILLSAMKDLAEYGDCPLFLEGLKELGLIGGKEYWWDCELFQVGLKEVGLLG